MGAARDAGESAGHPDYDRIYEDIIGEHLRPLAGNAALVRGLTKRFRQGPMLLCSREIGKWINRRLRQAGWTQQQLAERLDVDRSAVAYWIKGGNIHLLNLAQVLIEFGCQWSELPVPERQELALAAYLAALPYVREQLNPAQPKGTLDRERFWCLFHLFSEPHWEDAMRRRDVRLLAREAERIRGEVAAALGREPSAVIDVEYLKQLVKEWGVAWMVCIGQVPRKWTVR